MIKEEYIYGGLKKIGLDVWTGGWMDVFLAGDDE